GGGAKAPSGDRTPPIEVLPAVLESMRRSDEFMQARAIVPDDASFKPTGTKSTRPEDEEEAAFLKNVWGKASLGITPAGCEASVPADSYRIRRLYAHWLEEGAIAPR
ncbi:MAG: hypothetical protein ACRD1Z_23170, partial [Vicinamibacteria bacterium]